MKQLSCPIKQLRINDTINEDGMKQLSRLINSKWLHPVSWTDGNSSIWLDLLARGVNKTWLSALGTDLWMEMALSTVTRSGLEPPTLHKKFIHSDKSLPSIDLVCVPKDLNKTPQTHTLHMLSCLKWWNSIILYFNHHFSIHLLQTSMWQEQSLSTAASSLMIIPTIIQTILWCA